MAGAMAITTPERQDPRPEAQPAVLRPTMGAVVPELVGPASAQDRQLVKFFAVSVTCLLIGTIQGVLQTIPPIQEWLHASGEAGHWIDPLAHAHINLVGGVTIAISALIYYVLPRVLGRPIFSSRLTDVSFWTTTLGVFGFYVALVGQGLIAGTLMHQGQSFDQAAAAVQPLRAFEIVSAVVMGVGYWSFVANVYLTLARGPRA
jgi:cytochrome c oxidase cbb3-type subunit 1